MNWFGKVCEKFNSMMNAGGAPLLVEVPDAATIATPPLDDGALFHHQAVEAARKIPERSPL